MTPTNKFQLRGMLKKTVLLLSSSYMGLTFAAGDLPSDYVGNPSFRLGDDQQLSRLRRETDQKKKNLETAERKLNQAKTNIDVIQNQNTKLKDENTRHQSQIDNADKNKQRFQKIINDMTAQIAQAQQKVQAEQQKVQRLTKQKNDLSAQRTAKQQELKTKTQECRTTPTPECRQQAQALRQQVQGLARQIAAKDNQIKAAQKAKSDAQKQVQAKTKTKNETQAKLNNLPAQIKQFRDKIAANNRKIRQNDQKINTLRPQLQAARQAKQRAEREFTQTRNHRNDYRIKLVDRIMELNRLGAQEGAQDGRYDGRELAQRLGDNEGFRDGDLDGDERGTMNGRDRDYTRGKDQGLLDGADRAQFEGKRDGTKDGTRQGNIDAATADGQSAGDAQAQASNASKVGTKQGKTAGMERAVNTGRLRGTATGEQQAIDQAEAKQKKTVDVLGPFAGSFARNVPTFPRGHRGRSYDPNSRARRQVVKKAFEDGYIARYREGQRRAFGRNIDGFYNNSYDNAYDSAYRKAFNDFYQADYNEGLADGEKQGFDRDFPGVYRTYFDDFRAKFAMNPNQGSAAYKNTFKVVKKSTYDRVYEEIRADYFNQFEASEFNANIGAQTEKFRLARFNDVASVYKKGAVLKFESSSIADAGNNGVGAKDGVYMPNEDVVLDVVVTNYGEKAATNVSVNLGSGKVKLPAIPALSTARVKGIAKTQMNVGEGQTKQVAYTLSSPLNLEAKIQGKFYENKSNGVLESQVRHSATAKYPLALTSLALSKTLLLGQPNQLNLSVFNQANRNYIGPIKIELTDDSRTNVVVKSFADIQSLGNSATFNDATVLVNDESEAYSEITLNAKIYKNNVLLGYLRSPLTVMAKAPYKANQGDIVVVANSDYDTRKLLDVLAQTGGVRDSAVLDLSLPQLNSQAINQGFSKKTLVILDEGNGNVLKQMDQVLANSKNVSLIAVDGHDLHNRLMATQSFKGSDNFDITLRKMAAEKIYITNPFIAGNHSESFVLAQAQVNDFLQKSTMFKHSQKSNDEFFQAVQTQVNETNFYAPTLSVFHMMQFFNLRMLQEVLVVNQAYRHFNSAEKYKDMIKHDKNMFHNRLIKLVGSVNKNNVGLALAAYDAEIMLKKATRYYKPIEDKMKSKIKDKLWGAFFSSGAMDDYDDIKDDVRKYNKNLSKKMVKYENIYSALDLSGVSNGPNFNGGPRNRR